MTREEFVRFVSASQRLERHLRAAAAITRVAREARRLAERLRQVVGGPQDPGSARRIR